MERHLRGGNDLQSAVGVDARKRAERLHHALLVGARGILPVDHDIARRQLRLDVAVRIFARGDQIAAVVRAARGHQRPPALLRVDQRLVVHRLPGVKDRRQNLILHLDEPDGCQRLLFRLRRHDGDRVAHAAQMAVEDQAVVRAELRIRLARLGKARARHIPVGEHAGHARQLLRARYIDLLNHRVRVRAVHELDAQAVPGRNVRHIHRLAGQQRGRILLGHRRADAADHAAASLFAHARTSPQICSRYFCTARRWLT